MNVLMIPAALSISLAGCATTGDCPYFGSLDQAQNDRCFIEDMQGYADTLLPDGIRPVVLSEDQYVKGVRVYGTDMLFIDGECIVLLQETYELSDLWDAEDRCGRGL